MSLRIGSVRGNLARTRVVALLLLAIAAPCAAGKVYVAIVVGLSGEERFEEPFRTAGAAMASGSSTLGVAASRVRLLQGKEATADAMRALFAGLGRDLAGGDELIVMLVGHGTYDGSRYKFNIPGPDITDEDLKTWLDGISGERQLVVLATSSSGGALEALESERRLVVAATKSGAERNATVFGQYWGKALSSPAADTDKNERISAAEAFSYAAAKVAEHYASRDQLATEHPRMEGGGANGFIVARLKPIEMHSDDPKLAALLRRRGELEAAVERLRGRKNEMELEVYMRLLQDVLLELSTVESEIEQYESTE